MADDDASADTTTEKTELAGSLISEIGMTAELVGDEVHGRTPVTPEMLIPGTTCLRTSLVAAWTDTLVGFQAIGAASPRVPITLDLAVDLFRAPLDCTEITATARVLKAGSEVLVAEIDYAADGEPLGLGTASFVIERKVKYTLPPISQLIPGYSSKVTTLTHPYAEQAECRRESGGVASLTLSRDKLNAARSLNGGLAAIVVEEAVLSAVPDAALTSMSLRYLRAGRVGPFIGIANVVGDFARVEVRDEGQDSRLIIAATTRVAGLSR